MLCVLFETRYIALFDGVLMKSQVSLLSQTDIESMKKLMLLFCFTEKPTSLGVRVERNMVISKSLINFTLTTLFSTPEIIIPVHSSSVNSTV